MNARSPLLRHLWRQPWAAACLAWAAVLGGCAASAKGPDTVAASSAQVPESTATASTQTPQPELQPPAPQAKIQELQGQLSIKLHAFGKTPAKGLSLGFFFSGDAHKGQLDLITLMGSQLARVDWASDEVWLTDDKGRHRYESMAQLSAAVLSEALPLQSLIHWMQGMPDPEAPSTPGGQPQSFVQSGWTIDQSELSVKKLTATRKGTASQRGVFVKVYLDR
jgi:outer membrane biogenesis lipoprotein LolB